MEDLLHAACTGLGLVGVLFMALGLLALVINIFKTKKS